MFLSQLCKDESSYLKERSPKSPPFDEAISQSLISLYLGVPNIEIRTIRKHLGVCVYRPRLGRGEIPKVHK